MVLHSKLLLRSITLVLVVSSSAGFVLPSSSSQIKSYPQQPFPKKPLTSNRNISQLNMNLLDTIVSLRGGGGSLANTVTSTLTSGPWGIVTLWGIASSVVVPLTLVRQAYSFSVGYGYSVMTMGLFLAHTFTGTLVPTDNLLISSVIFYGFRLGTFLVLRNQTVPSKKKKLGEFDKSPRLKRIPLAVSVSLFYALLTSPAMFALRSVQDDLVTKCGIGVAWLGALLEAVADGQKYLAKRGNDESKDFAGPTGGVYRICRHPNYLGEVVFWFGLALSGVSSFGNNILAYLYSALGLYGIFSIMTSATKRLDQQQSDKYQGQAKYDDWRSSVKAPIFPLVDKE